MNVSRLTPHQGAPAIQISQIKDIKAFEALRDAWNLLLQRNPVQDAFLTWEWLYAWWKHYRKPRELWLVTAWTSDELVGVAPLMLEERRKYGLKLRVLCNVGTPDVDVGGFIIQNGDPQIYTAVSNYLIGRKRLWDVLELNEMRCDGPEINHLLPLFENSGYVTHQKSNPHFYIPVQGEWEGYLNRLPPKFRREIRSKVRRIEEQSRLTLEHHVGKEVTWQEISTIFEINEYAHFPHLYCATEERAFQREIFELMREQGWLNIFLLYVDDQPVAYNYGFTYDNKFEDWRAGFNIQYSDHSIGKILYLMTIEDCFERAYREIDFLCGDEHYKTRWQTQERTYTQLRFVATNRPLPMIAYIWLPKLKALINRSNDRKT